MIDGIFGVSPESKPAITLTEIPVQIINAPNGSMVILRVPNDWPPAARGYLRREMTERFMELDREVSVVVLGKDVELAVAVA